MSRASEAEAVLLQLHNGKQKEPIIPSAAPAAAPAASRAWRRWLSARPARAPRMEYQMFVEGCVCSERERKASSLTLWGYNTQRDRTTDGLRIVMSSRARSRVPRMLAMEAPKICKEGSCNTQNFSPTALPSSEKSGMFKTKLESQGNFFLFQDAIRTLNTLQTNASYLEQTWINSTSFMSLGQRASSPHLVQVRERIRINGQPISQELFSKYFWQVYNRLEETKDSHHASMPAYFRFLTIMAFHVFLQEKVDLAVIEVGIGGAYDCTNICPLFLCPDLDAFEDDDKFLQLGLAGDHQRSNAALALQLSHTWLDRCGYLDTGELKDSWRTSGAPSKRVPCLAPAFKPDQPMVQGLQATVWLGRNQVLHHGPVTWYIDGAHTTSSMQACVRWFHQAALNEDKPTDLPFPPGCRRFLKDSTRNGTTPCHFDYAVFCPNYTEVSTVGNADQQNFNVTLENVLTRCLQNQNQWNRLMEAKLTQDPWFPVLPEVGGWLKQPPLHSPPIFAASSARPLNSNSLVFPCISHALQWISQGRDPNLPALAPQGLHPHPVASSGAVLLKEAVAIRVLVTGSLHLVGGVLKLLDPTLSQ
ncbi:putative Folylpolyglutamate synthase protein [Naja naja]|nr:putative Folylpolyglutamate synthase protein [Naja naja]